MTFFMLYRNLILIGFGKAVAGMAEEIHKLVGQHIVKGVLSLPLGSKQQLRNCQSSLLEAENIWLVSILVPSTMLHT